MGYCHAIESRYIIYIVDPKDQFLIVLLGNTINIVVFFLCWSKIVMNLQELGIMANKEGEYYDQKY
jgi:hypothetical protein